MIRAFLAVAALLASAPLQAQAAAPFVQSPAEALAQDASEYALHYRAPLEEAMARLRAQEESVAETDRIRELYRDRLAGIAIEHDPVYRILILLTGDDPVEDYVISAGGIQIPIQFTTGAAATREEMVEAIREHQADVRAAFPGNSGLGVDLRRGVIVLLAKQSVVDRHGGAEMEAELADIMDLPVRLRVLGGDSMDSAVEGGARLEGIDPADGRRYACTTGFVVTDGARTGIVTAAHCPDSVRYIGPQGSVAELDFVGQWGARYQDVQVHLTPEAREPVFYADTSKSLARRVTTWRNRESTRAGDVVCRRGETSGYSCAEVELVDYAPPGDLCGGPCEPMWVTIGGPNCRSGDSGGPIFSQTVAFGITKGGNYNPDGTCNFSYYMSTDYLPDGWSLLH